MWTRTYNEIFKSALVYIKRFVWYNVCDSQSAFNFLRRLHYHASCSYQVDKSCSYRVFSPQEFKQNDSRTSCSSSNCCTNFRETTRKREKKKSLCETLPQPFERQSHKMVKHTQTIRRQIGNELLEYVWPFCGIGA